MLDIAIEPFVLLPVLGGYSKGLLGKWLGISDALVRTNFAPFNGKYDVANCKENYAKKESNELATNAFSNLSR